MKFDFQNKRIYSLCIIYLSKYICLFYFSINNIISKLTARIRQFIRSAYKSERKKNSQKYIKIIYRKRKI